MNDPAAPRAVGSNKLASFVIVAAILYFAKEVLIPIALASLLSFLLAPLVVRLSRLGLGKALSVAAVTTLAFSVIGVIGWLVMTQLIRLTDELPRYQTNLHAKVQSLKRPSKTGALSRATGMVKELQKELDALNPGEEDTTTNAPSTKFERPLRVEVTSPKPTPLQLIANLVGPVLKPMATAGAVVFFVILMLLQRDDLRERFLKLASGGELNVATQAVDDATQRVSRYLLMQLIVNACYGIPIGVGLYFIGIPNAFLWGLLATLLRFIPFLGAWIAAAFPIVLAFAIDPGWSKPLLAIGLFLGIELISNNLLEPWLYGASTGVSNIALLVAAIFWTWLWGTAGLFLSTPLTVCLLVLGKYVPGLSFLSIVLGSDPVLEPEARFYQRMLAMDEEELGKLAEDFLRDRSLLELYDGVVLPALRLAEQDRHKGELAEVKQAFIVQATRDLIEVLGERADDSVTKTPPDPDLYNSPPVVCIPARDEVDELATLMLVQLMTQKNLPARAIPAKTLAAEWFKQIEHEKASVICISGVPPFAVSATRQACKQIKQQFPALKVVAGIWNARAQTTEIAGRLGTDCTDGVTTRLSDALGRIEAILQASEMARRYAANRLQERNISEDSHPAVQEIEPGEVFASVTRQVAKLLNVPLSQVTVLTTDEDFWQAHGGVSPDVVGSDSLRQSELFKSSVRSGELTILEDLTKEARFANDAFLKSRGIRFYASMPLRTNAGHLVGMLCTTDTEHHEVSERAKTLLRSIAERLVNEVEKRTESAAA